MVTPFSCCEQACYNISPWIYKISHTEDPCTYTKRSQPDLSKILMSEKLPLGVGLVCKVSKFILATCHWFCRPDLGMILQGLLKTDCFFFLWKCFSCDVILTSEYVSYFILSNTLHMASLYSDLLPGQTEAKQNTTKLFCVLHEMYFISTLIQL